MADPRARPAGAPRDRHAPPDRPARHAWRNLALDAAHLLTQFVAHEAHHRGQLPLIARQQGTPLEKAAASRVLLHTVAGWPRSPAPSLAHPRLPSHVGRQGRPDPAPLPTRGHSTCTAPASPGAAASACRRCCWPPRPPRRPPRDCRSPG
ncbi:MAG: hypothetical protein KA180_15015 [Gemmatimonadales bacterium]|nr:hypothetical protein [Gemmatimonadales bacterium]